MTFSVTKYADGNIGITYGIQSITIDSVRLIDRPTEEIADVIKWEFLGYGIAFEPWQLERLAGMVEGVL